MAEKEDIHACFLKPLTERFVMGISIAKEGDFSMVSTRRQLLAGTLALAGNAMWAQKRGVAIRSAPSFALGAARCPAKRKQGYRWARYRASKSCKQDADALDLAEGNMTGGAGASLRSALRSHRPQTRLEASCKRTGRPPGRLGPNRVETHRSAKAKAVRWACTFWRSGIRQ